MILGRSSAMAQEKDDNNVRPISRALVNRESITMLFILIDSYYLLNLQNNAQFISKINFRRRNKDEWNGLQSFGPFLIWGNNR